MTPDQTREALRVQINTLAAARNASQDPAEKAAANEAIAELQKAVRKISIGEADKLGGQVDDLIAELDKVLNRHPLDAVSALGRTIKKVREKVREMAPPGGPASA